MKRPNIFLYGILGFFLKIYTVFKGQRITRKAKIKAPCIILSNHNSFPDFAYTTSAVYPRRVNYLGADKFFYDPVLGIILKGARAIPKCLFQSDPVSILKTLKVLRKGGIIGIFPEGQISPVGVNMGQNPAIVKLLKKARVDVYIVKHKNAYLVNPPWTNKSFKGPVETEVDIIASKDKIDKMSIDKLNQLVDDRLRFNTHEYNEQKKIKFHLNDISNLESVIYHCPNCGMDHLTSNKHALVCPDCGKELVYDAYGLLDGMRLDQMYQVQEKIIQEKFDKDPLFTMTANVILQSYRGNRVRNVGQGLLELSRKGYRFTGIVEEKDTVLEFNPEHIPSLPTDLGINIQIYKDYVLYQFVFDDVRIPTQFVIAGEYIHRIKMSQNHNKK